MSPGRQRFDDARLAIFDLDGTLCDTTGVDDECFGDAVCERLGLRASEVDFHGAPHMTDASITRWLWESHRGRLPSVPELSELRADFVRRLEDLLDAAPHRFAPISGARSVFKKLRDSGWDVAIATGGWEPSARLKLAAAGLSDVVPMASSSDAETRVEILRLARRRAAQTAGRARYRRIVSVGDGPWDVRAAADLNWPLVGIGEGRRADGLRRAGAAHVLPGYEDLKEFLLALDTAAPPQLPG